MSSQQVNRLIGADPADEPTPRRGYKPRNPRKKPEPAPPPPATLEAELIDQLQQRRLAHELAALAAIHARDRKLAGMTAIARDLSLQPATVRAGVVLWSLADDEGVYRGTNRQLGSILGVSKSAAQRAVDHLSGSAYLRRRPDGALSLVAELATRSAGRQPERVAATTRAGRRDNLSGSPTPLRGVGRKPASTRAGASSSSQAAPRPEDRPIHEHPVTHVCDGTGWVESTTEPGRLTRCLQVDT